MSWEFREYAQEGPWRDPAQFAGMRMPTGALRWLVILQVVGWVAAIGLRKDHAHLQHYLNGLASTVDARPLAILLHPFTPNAARFGLGIFILLFSIGMHLSLGNLVLQHFGQRRLLSLFIVGSLLSGFFYFSAGLLTPALAAHPLDYPAGGFAAWAFLAWRGLKFEYVPIGEKLYALPSVIAIFAGVLLAFELITGGVGAFQWIAAALFGALAVFVAPYFEGVGWPRWRGRRSKVRPSVHRGGDVGPELAAIEAKLLGSSQSLERGTSPATRSADVEIDAILEKISRSGVAALTPVEKAALEAARQARLREQ